MKVEDCYEELGVPPHASDAEVKAAWRRLAARWHPDRNASPQALRKIQRLNQALEAIRRSRREAGAQGEAAEPGHAQGGGDARTAEGAGAEAGPGPDAPPPIEHAVDLTLEEVATGCVRQLRGEWVEPCAPCEGTGWEPQPAPCAVCAGTGQVAQPLWFAWLASTVPCGACQGAGATRRACGHCDASGHAPARPWRGKVTIPAGVRAGSVLAATARLSRGRKDEARPLRVHVGILPHELFSVKEDGTLGCEIPVDGFAWMAERWIGVPTVRGLQQMRLRRGALSYRIREAGLPWQANGGRADCIVNVLPLFPQALDAAQEACVDALVATNSGKPATEAGARSAAWARRVEAWLERAQPQAKD